ncbi:MAG TPA: GFA family protein [Gaiellaceae bacterium]|nr:GFA family protein [Gaiellaceae bacterium]
MSVEGRCLCGAVRFRVEAPLRDVLVCHCVECRRWHGHVSAMTSVRRDQLSFVDDRGLAWIDSPDSDAHARRGFCRDCGSSLFWEPAEGNAIAIAAGTLEPPTGLATAGHWYLSQASDYYELPDDGLPRFPRSG